MAQPSFHPPLDMRSSALILVDLQNGIAGTMALEPHSGADVIGRGKAIAAHFRARGGTVVLVNVGWHADMADALTQPVATPMARPEGGLPAGWSDLVPGLEADGDIRITKRQWGAFHGTELDLQLRRRGIRTVVIGGVATNFGVESTARQAYEHGYAVVLLEDACASVSAAMHEFSFAHIAPRIALTTTTDALIAAGVAA